jgi:AAA15 family ATPase/GTPase
MEQIRIKNLRSLKDTGLIDIKPLTILVGKNSSGKSTFLRFFPLMKQTLSTKRNEPILWYSNQNVDFGSFDESINKESKEKILSFEFKFKTKFVSRRGRQNPENPKLDFILNVELKEKSLKKISIQIYDRTITFTEVDNSFKLGMSTLN